ncbi:DUF2341 domain-containing protein [Neptuniibacter sp.]|uniref:DUF2341 domain-containing protein n=1 Tax=Neptuniibacter sp. TaxID=1962643 RepID=UPI00263A2240|nr:DUF2341 domain-containing protein [Neptuniibacter sp.]MCP4594990.1 DUF2341 domain-containing protein [Neptuniibacter sp.]
MKKRPIEIIKKAQRGVLRFGWIFILGLLLACPGSSVQSEVVSYNSPLIWSISGEGDFTLEQYTSPGTYELSRAIVTSGRIRSITASWKFQGQVKLEVSADDGVNYTQVVNGVTLSSGFRKGSRLKWRVVLGAESVLSEIRISYTDASGLISNFGQPLLSGFAYRKPIYINNASGREMFNYQLKINVGEASSTDSFDVQCHGAIYDDFEDIRFTSTDRKTILPHYLETIKSIEPSRQAVCWVNIPQIPVEGIMLYMYYGNTNAEDISSADAVFDFYDDFKGTELNVAKWALQQGESAVSEKGLELYGAQIASREYKIKDGVIEYRAKAEAGNEIRVVLRASKEDLLEGSNQIAYSSNYTGAEHCVATEGIVRANESAPITSGVDYNYRVSLKGTQITFQRYDDEYQNVEAEVTYTDVAGLTTGYIGLTTGVGRKACFKWVRVRRYPANAAEVDPGSALSKPERVDMPYFADLQLNKKGNLVLKDDETQGNYVSTGITLPYEARIFVPSYGAARTDEGIVKLGVSMDRGKAWIKGTWDKRNYFVSKKDIMRADKLKFRLDFERVNGVGAELEVLSIDYKPGTITLLEPNGGEQWQSGASESIFWSAQEYGSEYYMLLEYSLDKGKNYEVITEEAENTGKYTWDVPKNISSEEVLVRISDSLYEKVFDISDTEFAIFMKKEIEKPEEAKKIEEELIKEKKKGEKGKRGRRRQKTGTPEPEVPAIEVEDVDLDTLTETSGRVGTKAYEALVKLGDNYHSDPDEDARACFKHGDIVLIKPAGYAWTDSERSGFLIVELFLTEEEAIQLMQPKKAEMSRAEKKGERRIRKLKKRANRINLKKLGISKRDAKKAKVRRKKLKALGKRLKGKALKVTVIEEKKD